MTALPFELPVPGEPLPRTHTRFREAGPVVPVRLPGGIDAWAVTTYDAVREVLSGDDKLFGKHSSHWPALRDGAVPADWPLLPLVLGEHMLVRDGAEHRRLRGLLAKAFTRARVEALRPWLAAMVDGLLDDLVEASAGGRKPVDLVPLFTEQVPTAVICELFGVPEEWRAPLRGWSRTLVSQDSTAGQTHAAGQELMAYLGRLAEEKRREPGDDLTTALVRARDDQDRLSTPELVDSLFLLLIAGHETTVHLLGHAVVNLLAHPDQLARARAGGLWQQVAEETMRLRPPISAAIFRYALEPVEIAGVPIPAGDPVMVCFGGAATDPGRYGPAADTFDLTREPREHLAFGHGVHTCLGAPLARLEAEVALARLFDRLPGIGAAVPLGGIPYSRSFLTYGPQSIPVHLGPARELVSR
ncbi:cytochrome P450 [Nonomuraea sp. MG754425]|uniref:cytochrome P450 family protein n=1 Tax=Nonomuraea sp. MG754425 TaxID=2570319 RepID=UPI001F200D5F|nr:cytochrome P450 [Nonomuraea sp. MG754425]MCF6475694.1 cytochrome P450 [Nonomuraea sp. MG754425]